MQSIDLNLLPVVVALVEEENVTRAAARLNLSVPATSRALDRARKTFGDPLLVRSGRGVVATPRALALLPELVVALHAVARVVERPAVLDPDRIRRTFTIRANEAVIAAAGAHLIALAAAEAPRSEIRFELEASDDIAALRHGTVDLAIGSYGDTTTDICSEALLDETLVAVVRSGHPKVAASSRPTLKRFADLQHIVVSRKGQGRNTLDEALSSAGYERHSRVVLPSFSAALAMVMQSDATTIAPLRLTSPWLQFGALDRFVCPLALSAVTVSQHWHASNSADQSHQWLRSCVQRTAHHVDTERAQMVLS